MLGRHPEDPTSRTQATTTHHSEYRCQTRRSTRTSVGVDNIGPIQGAGASKDSVFLLMTVFSCVGSKAMFFRPKAMSSRSVLLLGDGRDIIVRSCPNSQMQRCLPGRVLKSSKSRRGGTVALLLLLLLSSGWQWWSSPSFSSSSSWWSW